MMSVGTDLSSADIGYSEFTKLVRFLILGAGVTAAGLLLLYVLVDVLGLWYILATALAFILLTAAKFAVAESWVFRRSSTDVWWRAMGFAQFAAVHLMALLLNLGGMYVAVDFSGVNYLLSHLLVGALVSIGWTYGLSRFWVFQGRGWTSI